MTQQDKNPAANSFKRNQKIELRGDDGRVYNMKVLGEKKPPRLTKDQKHAAEIAALKDEHENHLRIWNRDKSMRDAEADGLRKQVCDLREETHALREKLCRRENLLLQIGKWTDNTNVGEHSLLIRMSGRISGIIAAERDSYEHAERLAGIEKILHKGLHQ